MLFNSFEFICIFLPLLCVVFALLQCKNTLALSVLLLGSLIFYAYHSIADLFLMAISVLFNFTLGQFIAKNKKILTMGLIFNVALIIYFKYAFFIVQNIQNISHISWNIEQIALPLGISFFTFQQIAYLVDTYYGSCPERNFLKYALLVSFFPHSIAGPLVQYKDIGPQFNNISLSSRNFAIGGTIFITGLFKKVVIADGLAPCVNAVFESVAGGITPSFFEAWVGAIGYTLQLYFDFSGYSDMAIGLAKIFNVSFPFNFDSPYKASSIIDFWRKWHITLSMFLKKYVYIPFGGNRSGTLLKYRNIFLTMMIGGVWHGANWTFILWGGLHGFYLVINHLWHDFSEKNRIKFFDSKIYDILSWSLTMLCVILGWVVFRAETFKSAFVMWDAMLGFQGISISPSLKNIIPHFSVFTYKGFFANQIFYFKNYFFVMFGAIFICFFLPNIKTFLRNPTSFDDNEISLIYPSEKRLALMEWSPSMLYSALMACMSIWIFIIFLSQRKIEFLYFNF